MDKRDIGLGVFGLIGIAYVVSNGMLLSDYMKKRKHKNAETFDAELKKDSCCCGATVENPCLCMEEGVMNCSAVEPKCPCYAAKDAESFEAQGKPESVEIKKSTNSEKKLMAIFTYRDGKTKTTHFGQRGASDYTKHGDNERMERYLERHGGGTTTSTKEDWKDPITAGALSRWILWNKPSLNGSFNDFKKRFNLKGDLKVSKSAESFEAELSHEDKATRIYEGIQQNINNPETVRFYYELFYGEPPAEDYEGDMALDVIEAVQQNLNGKEFVDYMYGEMSYVACKQENCPHGHCPRCGNCDDVLDNDGDGSEDDDMFCGGCGECRIL